MSKDRKVWVDGSTREPGHIVVNAVDDASFEDVAHATIDRAEAESLFIELGERLGISDEHIVIFTMNDWTIEHPLSCRLKGEMADCPTIAVVTNDCRKRMPSWVKLVEGKARYRLVYEDEYDNWRYDKVEP